MKGGEAVDKPLRLTQSAFEDATDRKKCAVNKKYLHRQQKNHIFVSTLSSLYATAYRLTALT